MGSETAIREAQTSIDRRGGKINLAKLIELRSKGLTINEIAKYFGCCKQAVDQSLKRFDSDPKHLKDFRENKADVYEFIQSEVIQSLDPVSIQKTPFIQRVTSIAILEDKIRLIRGQSTGNLSVKTTVEHYANKLEEINKALASIDD